MNNSRLPSDRHNINHSGTAQRVAE